MIEEATFRLRMYEGKRLDGTPVFRASLLVDEIEGVSNESAEKAIDEAVGTLRDMNKVTVAAVVVEWETDTLTPMPSWAYKNMMRETFEYRYPPRVRRGKLKLD